MLLLQKGMLLNNIISGVLKNVSEQVLVAKNLDQRRPKIHYFFWKLNWARIIEVRIYYCPAY